MDQEQIIVDRYTPTTPCPFKKKDWVVERIVQHPGIGQVKDCYWDGTEQDWVVDLVLFNADGRRIGRESPSMGGPKTFEPAVPVRHWDRITEPAFPLSRDGTGFRDWRSALQVVGPRSIETAVSPKRTSL